MIQPKVTIKGNFKRSEALKKAYERADGSYFTLGVHSDAGAYPVSATQPDPPSVGEVAWWLEKGTRYMPARPFLYPAINENLDGVRKKLAEGLVGMALHGWTVQKALTVAAVHCLTLLQNKVKSNVGPALSGTWDPPRGYLGLKRKREQSMRTLIATGLLFRSLAYRITLGDGAQEELQHGPEGEAPGAHEQPVADHAAGRARAREEAGKQKDLWREQRALHKQAQVAKSSTGHAHKATNHTGKKRGH